MLINQQQKLATLCEQLRALGAPIAFDTEFISERRYAAKLCLVQVHAHRDQTVIEALIDPLALDLAPLLDLMADEKLTKIVHAGGQDLQILFQEYGCQAQHIFDTQIAGAFLGYGHQIGYADIVRRGGGPQLSKAQQLTDWAVRPLTNAQMEYALDDVRYLPGLYEMLRRDLEARGRLGWAATEFRRAEARAREALPPEELYRKLNLSGLARRNLAIVRELAAVRDKLARAVDKPPSFIVPDSALLQMAKHPPQDVAALRSQRGMPGLSSEAARALMAAITSAEALPPEQWPERHSGERPDPQVEVVANLLGLVAQVRADTQSVSRAYLAPRDQIVTLAAWWLRRNRALGAATPTAPLEVQDGLPLESDGTPLDLSLLQDWRRELLGAELLELLQGRLALALDASQPDNVVRIVPMQC